MQIGVDSFGAVRKRRRRRRLGGGRGCGFHRVCDGLLRCRIRHCVIEVRIKS
jgi:hypothetical protein